MIQINLLKSEQKKVTKFGLFVGVGFAALSMLLITSCSKVEFDKAPPQAQTNAICNPFGGEPTTPGNGLRASLHAWADPSECSFAVWGSCGSLAGYLATPALNSSIYFSQLNNPTVTFDQGFGSGSSKIRNNGQILTEFFGLHIKSRLKLPAGDYQIGILSDDGSVVAVDGQQQITDNDGWHQTKFGCGTAPISFNGDNYKSLDIGYFQGPRDFISLVLVYRPWTGGGGSFCGHASDVDFFNASTGAKGTAYQTMEAEQWKPIEPQYFFLEEGDANPCG
ncbi:MAG: hypothetical protein AB7F59_12010 [Bdellovibrionales bacterium]